MEGRDPESGRDKPEGTSAALRGGLLLGAKVGLPFVALWTVAGQVADWHLAVFGSPWDQLVPLLAGAVFLFGSVRGLLRWAVGTLGTPDRGPVG